MIRVSASSPDSPIPRSVSPRDFASGDIVWGPHGGFPSWPGKMVTGSGSGNGSRQVDVCWFGSGEVSGVPAGALRSLSDGLEAHHRERKKLRKWVHYVKLQSDIAKYQFAYANVTVIILRIITSVAQLRKHKATIIVCSDLVSTIGAIQCEGRDWLRDISISQKYIVISSWTIILVLRSN